jgi:hypothetical protein
MQLLSPYDFEFFDPMQQKTLSELLDALRSDDWYAVKAMMEKVEATGLWPAAMSEISSIRKPHPNICNGFHTLWTERGHRIREHLADDSIMFDVLRILLPNYKGSAQTLYRGESSVRHERRAYGTAWSSRKEIAAMFASGLNAMHEGGGVLLLTNASASAIIAGPSPHSIYLGEYEHTVDRRQLDTIGIVERFPQSS